MKKLVVLIGMLLTGDIIIGSDNLSPWIVIENKTPFGMDCSIKAWFYGDDYQGDAITIVPDNNRSLVIQYTQFHHDSDLAAIMVTIMFSCNPYETKSINPLFADLVGLCNPKIQSVACTYESLQLTAQVKSPAESERYFSLQYHPKVGIVAKAQQIPWYMTLCSNLKQGIKNIILAALHAADWLPY